MDRFIKTLILEDRYIDLVGIRKILDQIKHVLVVAECRTPQEGLAKARELEPDFFMVDGDIFGNKKGGEDFARAIRENFPDAKILGITTYDECLEPLRRAGCNHVIHKELIDNQAGAEQHIREVLTSSRQPRTEPRDTPVLTDIEMVALRLIAVGKSDREISEKLDLKSIRAAKHIRESLMEKFSAQKSTELIMLAFKLGILSTKDNFDDD